MDDEAEGDGEGAVSGEPLAVGVLESEPQAAKTTQSITMLGNARLDRSIEGVILCRVIVPCGSSPPRSQRRAAGLVEAAGVEPASEAVSPGISTSVSGILVLAWRLLPTGSASASRGECPTSGPWRPCGGDAG